MRLSLIASVLALVLLAATQTTAASVRVAVVQLRSSDAGDFERMLADARAATKADARAATKAGARIVVFPEASDLGWLNPRTFFDAVEIPGPTSSRFVDIGKATGAWVVAGLSERGRQVTERPASFEVYDAAVMIDPSGTIVLHHRQFNVVKNAFSSCPAVLDGGRGCSYSPGSLSNTKVATTPFGSVGLFVCDDAFTYDTASLDALGSLAPDLVIIPWGITAGAPADCSKDGFNATGFAAKAATYLKASVVGANATGERVFGRFLPSWYCGTSGIADSAGRIGGVLDAQQELGVFDVPIAP